MIYKFKTGSYRGLDPQAAGEELERIRQAEGGRLATQTVWREARRESSPLHNAFTWDVQKAAEERWADQARALVRAVVVIEGDVERSAFINVSVQAGEPDEPVTEHYYQSIQVVAKSPIEYESALIASKARLAQAQHSLDELLSITPRKIQPNVRRARKHVQSASAELGL